MRQPLVFALISSLATIAFAQTGALPTAPAEIPASGTAAQANKVTPGRTEAKPTPSNLQSGTSSVPPVRAASAPAVGTVASPSADKRPAKQGAQSGPAPSTPK